MSLSIKQDINFNYRIDKNIFQAGESKVEARSSDKENLTL